MIKIIQSERELDCKLLLNSILGRKMVAYMKAYGPKCNFCRFYKINDKFGHGFMLIINSTLIICGDDRLDVTNELEMFVKLNLPFRIEGDLRILEGLRNNSQYRVLNRTTFELVPDQNKYHFVKKFVNFDPYLLDVYKILIEGFPNISDFYSWYTDTSYRCRHGISHVFTYRNCTTASIVFDIGDKVLIGQVATKVAARGCGYAREFLKWLAMFLNNFGKKAYLLSLDIRVSFYKEIGFSEVYREIVLERINIEYKSPK